MTTRLNFARPLVGLSPMDGITDFAFRSTQVHVAKPDLLFTEFVSSEGLVRGGVKLYDLLLYRPAHRPIIGQLFGKDAPSFYQSTVVLCHLGFDGIDLNFGCPAKTVTQHGGGAALIASPVLAAEIVKSARRAITDWSAGRVTLKDLKLNAKTLAVITRNLTFSRHTPVSGCPTLSVKTRLGVDSNQVNSWIPHLAALGLDFITLHGRTLKQGYSGTADWEAIRSAAELSRSFGVPLLGNGDITSLAQAQKYSAQYGVQGVLIGRSASGNPWVFSDHLPTWPDRFKAMKFHLRQFQLAFPDRRLDPLRRIFLEYTKFHPRAKILRSKIVTLTCASDILSLEPEFTAC